MSAEFSETGGYPDAKELEKIANRLFSALPNASPEIAAPPTRIMENPRPASERPTNLPDQHFAGPGHIPGSVAGAGISPSAANRADFDLRDPQTSLPDPHFEQGQASGIANDRNIHGDDRFPFTPGELPFEAELKSIFENIQLSFPSAQLPTVATASFSDAPFYFLEGKHFAPRDSSPAGMPGSAVSTASAYTPATGGLLDVNAIRQDFPILQERVNGYPLIWLDNAATTQKPSLVIDRLSHFYKHENSNIHRAAHELAARATDAYESARKKVQTFLNAASVNEIVFVRGSTEAINLVSQSWGDQHLKAGDEIVVSHLEHHANIVPWQLLAGKKGLTLRVIPVDDDGQVLLDEYARLLGPKTKLVSFTQVSNALGTITPAKKMVEMAHAAGAKVLVDGAQAVSHLRADVAALNCDWYVFSGHKVFGPTGIGVLYGKEELLNQTQPWQGGGNMIQDVTFEHTVYQNAPGRFEAGTGNIADAVGLGAAIDYVTRIGIDRIAQYEHYLLQYATRLMNTVPGLRLIGTAADKASVLSFVLKGYKTEEVGKALNQRGIAVRSGHHCAQPILRRFGLETTVRPSLAFYNTCGEIDAMVGVLLRLSQTVRNH
jgi:cysteine desulfurase / selenocysteine lyase